ncbi:MAG: bifunctional adenosylcobinamide kinase/adenosylcobinamide-phosphate guanylyltransferase [Synergistaceae bacterium]|nr:bifunctional adenosylcobinamide kinase/adenosylcobinamide-phosphate guanylyltransferase [Synergistaceae bacterium]
MLILISGASGSGKSSYAEERLAKLEGSKKIYIATAEIYDEEMKARVERHKARRKNKGFVTIERPRNLSELKNLKGASVLLEALTTWLANEMFAPSALTKESEPPLGEGRTKNRLRWWGLFSKRGTKCSPLTSYRHLPFFKSNPLRFTSFTTSPRGGKSVKGIEDVEELLAPPVKGERATKWRGGYLKKKEERGTKCSPSGYFKKKIVGKFKKIASPQEKIFSEIKILKSQCRDLIIISDDIFSDGIIYDESTEKYIAALAWLVKKIAGIADEVTEIFAGLPLRYNTQNIIMNAADEKVVKNE